MSAPSFDLVDILRTIQKKRRFIIIITVVAMILGGVFFAAKKKKYKADCQFLVNNPLYGDRSTLFRSYETRYVDYFGGDDDLDKVTALANSDTVKDRVIRNCDFDKIYNSGDINDPKAHANYMHIFDKNFNVKMAHSNKLLKRNLQKCELMFFIRLFFFCVSKKMYIEAILFMNYFIYPENLITVFSVYTQLSFVLIRSHLFHLAS
jgi:Chain length determinant protein